jgi:carboxymethylenebutenolidase
MGIMIDIEGTSAWRAEPVGDLTGALIVIHEIWGLVDHIRGVADRFAAEGYLVVAPDILSVIGVTPEVGAELHALQSEPDEAKRLAGQPRLRELFSGMNSPDFAAGAVASLEKVVDYLAAQPGVDGRIAVTGFCFGGTYSFALAAADPRVRAAVPWYGSAPAPDEIARIAAPVLAIYGSDDERLMGALPGVTAAMADAGVDFTAKVYEGAKHAFFNDTGANYDPDAAADAFPLALAFLRKELA